MCIPTPFTTTAHALTLLTTTPTSPKQPTAKPVQFLDRDHSILAFNERVLDWVRRDDVPLLERLRYLCIVSSNLDEFLKYVPNPT